MRLIAAWGKRRARVARANQATHSYRLSVSHRSQMYGMHRLALHRFVPELGLLVVASQSALQAELVYVVQRRDRNGGDVFVSLVSDHATLLPPVPPTEPTLLSGAVMRAGAWTPGRWYGRWLTGHAPPWVFSFALALMPFLCRQALTLLGAT